MLDILKVSVDEMASGNFPFEDYTYGKIIDRMAREKGSKTFIYYKEQQISFSDVHTNTERLAAALQQLGIEKGEPVGLMLPNCPETIYCWFSLAKIGAIQTPIHTDYQGDFLKHVLKVAGIKKYIIDKKYLHLLDGFDPTDLPLETLIVHPDASNITSKFKLIGYDQLWQMGGEKKEVEVNYYDPIGILFTSGTTGVSKGIVYSHFRDFYNGKMMVETDKVTEDDILYLCTPLSHSYAQFMIAIPAFIAGASIAIAEKFSASGFLDDVRRYGCTVAPIVGSMAAMLLLQSELPDDSDNPLRCIRSCPKPIKIDYFEKRFGVILTEVFGNTESSTMVNQTPDEERIPGVVGKAGRYYEVEIHDEHDRKLPPGQVGELVCRPKIPYTTFLGYYNMEKATIETCRNFWLHLGDAGLMDEEGRFRFVGRVKDAIRRRGENISAMEVEAAVMSHPAVAECAAIGVPSELQEEEVKVVVVAQEGQQVDPEDLIRLCSEKLPRFMVPRYVEVKQELPKTPTAKVQKFHLREEGITPLTWDREKAQRRNQG